MSVSARMALAWVKLEPHRDTPARRPSPPLSFFVFDGFGVGGMFLLRACRDRQPRLGEQRRAPPDIMFVPL